MPLSPDEPDLLIEEVGGFEPIDESLTTLDQGWKDELNLAEFPIAALTDRIPDGQTTLVFEDRLERKDHPPIVRRLTIMGTAQARPADLAPTTKILVGLIQLTKRQEQLHRRQGASSRVTS